MDHLGPPDPGEEYPYGGHPLRHVYWADIGLVVVFSDFGFYRDDSEEHFVGWGHGIHIGDLAGWGNAPASLPLTTAEGIGIGATLADLEAAYPGRVELEAVCDPGGPPTAAFVAGRVSSIGFSFEQLPIDATSRIADMGAGAGPGC